MIEFVGVVPFLKRITQRVAMETMRFEPSPNRFFLTTLSRIYGVLINNLAPIKNCPRSNVTQLRFQGTRYISLFNMCTQLTFALNSRHA